MTAESPQHGAGPDASPPDVVIGARLPASLTSPARAREAVRHALAAWGVACLADEAELLASELIANAVEHADGQPVDLFLRGYTTPAGRRGIACEVTDTSPVLPRTHHASAGSERGRGLAIVAALATASGIAVGPDGKTAWFTLTAPEPGNSRAEPELEAGA